MDPRNFLHSSVNNLPSQMDSSFYQFVQEQYDPIIPPFPPTLDTASSFPMDPPVPMDLSTPIANLTATQRLQNDPIIPPFPLTLDAVSGFPMDPPNPLGLSNQIANLMETQRFELEQGMRLQNNLLVVSLQEQRVRHMMSLMSAYDSIVKEKDEELAESRKKVVQLADALIRERKEKEEWKNIVQGKEAVIFAPTGIVQQTQSSVSTNKQGVGSSSRALRKGRGRGKGKGKGKEKQTEGAKFSFIPCRSCGSQFSCMLLIPCQHLCACKTCAAFLDACPMCNVKKIDSIKVSFE